EDIGIRLIKMRKLDGELVMIPAGELRVFGNLSIEFVRIATEIDVSYEQDIDQLTRALTDVAAEWADAHREILLDETPEVQSIVRMTESTIKLRVVARVSPGEQWAAERALLHLIKKRFDERGIEFPFPRRTVYLRNEPEAPSREPLG
ncbi:MAG: mechanosensitive ion channel family protein, partial [Rhodothermales bacterium]|nr:mechanosensitive ion channel family protein [Rhodothermales bacterium]